MSTNQFFSPTEAYGHVASGHTRAIGEDSKKQQQRKQKKTIARGGRTHLPPRERAGMDRKRYLVKLRRDTQMNVITLSEFESIGSLVLDGLGVPCVVVRCFSSLELSD